MFPPMANPNLDITATEFEYLVREWILKQSGELTSLEVIHNVKLEAYDSTYQIDVLAKFQAFGGAEFTVLIECKKHRHPVEREMVQVLHDKIRSLGAHKGLLFTTSGFQSGAIKYAQTHGIALVSIMEGVATYQTKSAFPVEAKPPAWLNLPKFELWHVGENVAGNISMKSLGRADSEINDMFRLPGGAQV